MINQAYPTQAEMERIIKNAHALRAQTLRTGVRTIGHWFAELPHKLSNAVYNASHS